MQELKWFLLALTTVLAFMLLERESGIAIVAISAAVFLAVSIVITD